MTGSGPGYYAKGAAPYATDAEAVAAHKARWAGTPELADAVSDSHVCGVSPANPVCCGDDVLASVYDRSDEGRQWYRDSAASLARRQAPETGPLVFPPDEFAAVKTVRDAVNGTRYEDGWRDSALALAAELDRASKRPGHPQATASQVRYAQGSLQAAAELARRQAQNVPDAPADVDPVPVDPASRTDSLSPADDMDPLFEVPNG